MKLIRRISYAVLLVIGFGGPFAFANVWFGEIGVENPIKIVIYMICYGVPMGLSMHFLCRKRWKSQRHMKWFYK